MKIRTVAHVAFPYKRVLTKFVETHSEYDQIDSEAGYDWPLKQIASYLDVQPKPGTAEGDRFNVLATLIEAYEEKHWPIDPPDPVDAIQYRMEQAGLNQADLAKASWFTVQSFGNHTAQAFSDDWSRR